MLSHRLGQAFLFDDFWCTGKEGRVVALTCEFLLYNDEVVFVTLLSR